MIVAQEFAILPSPSRVNKLSQDARGLVHCKVLWWHPSNIVFFESERASLVVARPGGECVVVVGQVLMERGGWRNPPTVPARAREI